MPTPFVPGPNVLQCEVRGDAQTIPVENVLYFQHATGITPVNAQSLVNALAVYFDANMGATLPTAVDLNEVYGTDLTTQVSPTYTSTPGLMANGTQAGDPLPRNNTLSISFRTAGRGKSSRGRNYWLGFVESQVTQSQVNSGVVTAIISAYNGLIGTGALDAGWTWGVFSRKANGAWRTTGLFQPITAAVVADALVDSQRGRLK